MAAKCNGLWLLYGYKSCIDSKLRSTLYKLRNTGTDLFSVRALLLRLSLPRSVNRLSVQFMSSPKAVNHKVDVRVTGRLRCFDVDPSHCQRASHLHVQTRQEPIAECKSQRHRRIDYDGTLGADLFSCSAVALMRKGCCKIF